MKYTEAIKKGFDVVNKNWQLVLVQIGGMFASFFGFLFVVGIPLAIAFVIFGLDLTELLRSGDLSSIFNRPSEIISKYFWLVILILASLLFYILMILVFGIFILGGSLGILSKTIKDSSERFNLKSFLHEGRRLFLPLTGFTTLIGLIFIVLAFILGLFGGSIAAIVNLAKAQAAVLALFLGIFFSLIMFVIGLVFILIFLSVTLYGAAIIALRELGPFRSIRESINYLYKHAGAFYLYCMVFGGYLILSLFVMFMNYPITLVPLIGPLIAIIYQFGIYVAQSYLGLVMIATVFCYYHSTMDGSGEKSGSSQILDIQSTPESSIRLTDTSEPQVPVQEDIPPEKRMS